MKVTCEHCEKVIEVSATEIDGLDSYVDQQVDDARAEVREEYQDNEDFVCLSAISGVGGRVLFELARAVRSGNRAEAELMLDKMADEIGPWAQEQVQQGRYSVRQAA